MRFDVIVVGGGAVGLATALALSRYGRLKAAVVERRSPAAGASGLGAGSVSLHRWLPEDVALVRRSLQLMTALEREGTGFAAHRSGRLTLAAAGAQAERLEDLARVAESVGVPAERLEADAAAARFPAIRFDDAGAILYSPLDAYIHPPLLVAALWNAARRAGVAVLEGTDVTSIAVGDGTVQGARLAGGQLLEAPAVVLATQAQTRKVLQGSGMDVPLKPYRTQVAFLLLPGEQMNPVVFDAITGFYSVPRNVGSHLAGNGTHAHDGDPDLFDREPDAEFLSSIASRFRHRFPGCGPVTATGGWAGICDMTPDGRPLIGPYGGVDGLHLACGFAGFGIMRALAAGEALAAVVAGEDPAVSLAPYRAGRFTGWQEFELNFGPPYDPLGE